MFLGWTCLAVATYPAMADALAEPPVAADPVAVLAAEVHKIEPTEVGAWARAEPRVLALDAEARARLLASVAEGTPWWAPLLNLYPGLGVGSLVSRDPRGAWLTLADGVAFGAMSIGFAMAMAESPRDGNAGTEGRRRAGRALVYGGLAGLAASRTVGVILPFTFRGRAHRELEQVFAGIPPSTRLSAFVISPARGGSGAVAGITVAF